MKKRWKWLTAALCLLMAGGILIGVLSAVQAAYVPATLTDLSTGTALDFRIDYGGPGTTIASGDTIVLTLTPSTSGLIQLYGFADNLDLYNDFGEVVGTRHISYNPGTGACTITMVFNSAYEGKENVTGWYKVGGNIMYLEEVHEEEVRVEYEINNTTAGGYDVPPSPPDPPPYNPGNFVKDWRYGEGSPATYIWADKNNPAGMEKLRWYLPVGYGNLTNRDLRASDGDLHWTLLSPSLAYSNNNPTGPRYDAALEPYLPGGTDEPFHYNNVFIDDYLDVDAANGLLYSSHSYAESSLRIVRIVGRDEDNAYRPFADSNFLKSIGGVAEEQIYRYLPATNSPFPGYRGLTIQEFFDQLQAEGQFAGYTGWEDILTFDLVTGEGGAEIPHFRLELGDLHFSDDYTGTIRILRKLWNNNVASWPLQGSDVDVDAKNLPYAYLIYYDTEVTELEVDESDPSIFDYFNFYNRATFSYSDVVQKITEGYLAVRWEGSGGGGGKRLSIRKVDENGAAVPGVIFTLTGPGGYNEARTTTTLGTLNFYISIPGEYTLTETLPPGSGLEPIEPLTFEVTQTHLDAIGPLALINLLPPGYANAEDITFEGATLTNIIVNRPLRFRFTNKYKPSGSLTLTKTVTGVGFDPDKGFEFTVLFEGPPGMDFSGILCDGEPFTNPGTVTLKHGQSATFTNIPPGATYTITETDYTTEGYTPSGNVFIKEGPVDAGETVDVTFTNTYESQPTSVTLNALKTAVGKDMEAGQFEFELYESDSSGTKGSLITSGTNEEGGTSSEVTFTPPAAFDYAETGTHYYLMEETSTDGGGWAVSKRQYLIKVAVEDDGQGQLFPSVTYGCKLAGESAFPGESTWDTYHAGNNATWPAFENTYAVTKLAADVPIPVRKYVEGMEFTDPRLLDMEFTFQLEQVDEDGEPLDESEWITVDPSDGLITIAGGDIIVPDIVDVGKTYGTYSFALDKEDLAAGKYYFKVSEVIPEPGEDGWTYCDWVYFVTVEVIDAGGYLTATVTCTLPGEEGSWEYTSFTNTYEEPSLPFSFTKTDRHGAAFDAGEAEFELYECTASSHAASEDHDDMTDSNPGCWAPFAPPKIAETDTAGLVSFGDLPSGDYLLVEIKTRPGLQLPFGQWLITIDASEGQITITGRGQPPAFRVGEEGALFLPNYPLYTTPRAGSTTALLYTASGTTLVIAGSYFGLSAARKRRRRKVS